MPPRRTSNAPATANQRELSAVDGLAQLSFAVHGLLESQAAQHDLSIVQTRLLGILRDRSPTMNELANLLALDKSSVSGLVDRAERRGLVARSPSKVDRRSTVVNLTRSGRSLVSRVAASFDGDVSTLLDHLAPPDRDALSSLVSRLLDAHATAQGIDLFATIDPGQVSASHLSVGDS